MKKTISIIMSIALSFSLFFAYTNSGLVFAENQTSASTTANNSTSSQNQTNSPSQTLSAQTKPGSIGQLGQDQSHSGQSQIQSGPSGGPVGQTGQGKSGQGQSVPSSQNSLQKQIDQQNNLNQQNQTGRTP
jgi:hypothetical protein